MPINNSGPSSTFHSLNATLILLFCLQLASSQICITSSGSICLQCAPSYQLINGACLPFSSSLPSTPTLIFLNKPAPQKLIYNVLPVVVSMHAGDAPNHNNKDVVDQFKVTPVPNSSLVNLYQLQANLTLANIQNAESDNSSISKQADDNPDQSASQGLIVDGNKMVNFAGFDNLTLGYLENDEGLSVVRQRVDAQKNLTAISQTMPADLTAVKEAVEPNLVQIRPKQSTSPPNQIDTVAEPLLIQVKQRNKTTANQQATANSASTTTVESSSTTTSNSNNQRELQLIKIGQVTQPNLVQVKQTQPNKPSALSNTSGIITLQQVGQQLTPINQMPIQVQIKKSENSSQSQQLLPVFTQTQNNGSLLPENIVKLELISPAQLPTLIQIKPATPSSSPANDFDWIKATRYELYNLTVVPQSLTQVSLKPSSLSLSNTYTFKCINNLTLFLQPPTSSTGYQLSYARYTRNLITKLSAQLKSHTLADRSTLCFDPPFQHSYQHLFKKYKSLLTISPIFAVYYQFCGFSKSFRIYFIDDSAFPSITVRECSIVVDLFRMMPAQVFLNTYESIVLPQ